MKQFNWGTGVAVFFSLFVIAIVAVVVFSTTVKPMLVEENYYQKDIAYQKQINREARTSKLGHRLQSRYDAGKNTLELLFPRIAPPQNINGTIHYYRPSDNQKDFSETVKIDSSYRMIINTGTLVHGYWKLKIDWNVADSTYYNEITISK